MSEDFKPFEPKPTHLKADYIKRKEKWDESLEAVDSSNIDHRRFNCTLQTPQVVNSFKKCVHKNEVSRKSLITCYRVVLQKILQDPDLSDEEFLSMYGQIQTRAIEVYERRSRNLRKIQG
jgi:hypothetical protein